jgi:hypothetical protein
MNMNIQDYISVFCDVEGYHASAQNSYALLNSKHINISDKELSFNQYVIAA